MTSTLRATGFVFLSAVFGFVLLGCGGEQPTSSTRPPGLEETLSVAQDAYIYGYPLVTMDMTRKQMTNVNSAGPERAPMGQFIRMRTYPTAKYRDVPGANTDTLYTNVWLDVSKEPWIFSIPDMGDRYYMTPMLDGYTNVFKSPGTRTTGEKPQEYAIRARDGRALFPQA